MLHNDYLNIEQFKIYKECIYDGNIEKAKNMLLETIPRDQVIYKYCRGLNRDWNRIIKPELSLSQAGGFNDPYDCAFLCNCHSNEIYNGENEYNLAVEKEIEQYEQDKKSYIMQNTVYVGCFSERNDSLLMWSHYGDEHRGLCIGYNLHDLIKKYNCFPVIYSDEMPQRRTSKKKSKKGLKSLILVLSFVLIFAVFFVGSYVYFTGNQKPDKIADASNTAAKASDKTDNEKSAEVSDEKVNVPDTDYIDSAADEKTDTETTTEVKSDTKTSAPSSGSQQSSAKSNTVKRKTTTQQSNKVAARRAGQSTQSTASSQKPGASGSTTQSPSASAGTGSSSHSGRHETNGSGSGSAASGGTHAGSNGSTSASQQPSQSGSGHSGSASQGSQPSQSGSQNKVIEKHEDSAAIILD